MTASFAISSRWLDGDLEDSHERSTFAEVSVVVADRLVTETIGTSAEQTVGGVRLPAVVLAEGLTARWWALLREPQRTLERQPRDQAFVARHRLDSLTPGYVFAPLGLWSGGDTIMAQVFSADTRFQDQRFVYGETYEPWIIDRELVEKELGSFIQKTIDRLRETYQSADELKSSWGRITESTHDPEELAWCINSGRLGLDPYDPDTLDLSRISDGISEPLFGDICEGANVEVLHRTCDWVRSQSPRLARAQPISLQSFGSPPRRNLNVPGFEHGYQSADMLRLRLNMSKDPVKSVDRVLSGADKGDQGRLDEHAPEAIEGLVRRQRGDFRAAVPARSARQRRFRMCRATYLAWRAGSDTDVAATPAETWRQQASRAFAAELLAPASLIKERYGQTGLNKRSIERLAEEWMCPPMVIVLQARNHGVPVKVAETVAHF